MYLNSFGRKLIKEDIETEQKNREISGEKS